jgi:hypothetical protein
MSINTADQTAKPDFSHRVVEGYNPACADNMIFEVETMLMRSKGMLNILSDLHLETHLNHINSDNVSWALMSVIRELDDVYALVSTYRDAIANQQA